MYAIILLVWTVGVVLFVLTFVPFISPSASINSCYLLAGKYTYTGPNHVGRSARLVSLADVLSGPNFLFSGSFLASGKLNRSSEKRWIRLHR